MKIRIFTVGGTIDKIYFDQLSKYEVGEPNIGHILRGLRLNMDYKVDSLLKKDSLDMSDEDRALICEKIRRCRDDRILVTHGTDTMVETAKALTAIENKTIVLTGALEPAMFKTSDAMFNIGGAVIATQALPYGTYIVMNGRVFDPHHVRKNREKGLFEDC